MRSKAVPFYANTSDNTHCFQAGLKTVLKHFLPKKDSTWEELDRHTNKHEGFWTWPTAGLLWLHSMGFEVHVIESFDLMRFAEHGSEYLHEFYGPEVAELQIKFTHDIQKEQKLAEEMLNVLAVENRIPSIEEIREFLEQGFLVAANVNSRILNAKGGYAGHFVVLYEYNTDEFILHDPGLPAAEARHVNIETFEKAWGYPNNKARNIIAIKK